MSAAPPPALPAHPHRYRLRVYFEDTDAGGIVYHANYLRYAERARSEFLRDLGLPHAEMMTRHGALFVVRRVRMDYLRPARLDDALEVETEVLEVGGASARLAQRFFREGEMLVGLEIGLAVVRVRDHRPVRLPAPWRDGLSRLLRGTDEG
jgi:acyl-CoA thioester hydrolase